MGKKQAVAIHRGFFNTLPKLADADPPNADLAWLIYDLTHDAQQNVYRLTHGQTIYTKFEPAMLKLTTAEAGPVEHFVEHLQSKLDDKLDNNPPDAPALNDITFT